MDGRPIENAQHYDHKSKKPMKKLRIQTRSESIKNRKQIELELKILKIHIREIEEWAVADYERIHMKDMCVKKLKKF